MVSPASSLSSDSPAPAERPRLPWSERRVAFSHPRRQRAVGAGVHLIMALLLILSSLPLSVMTPPGLGLPDSAEAATALGPLLDFEPALLNAAAPAGASHIWTFDESGGATALDSVAGTSGTLTNATRVAGRIGAGAVALTGSDSSYVSFPSSVGAIGTSDFTVAFWVNTAEQSLASFDLAGNRSAGSHGNFLQFRMTGTHPNGNGRFILEIDQDGNGTNYAAAVSGTGYNDGAWHHVAATRQGTSLKLYVNGALVGSAASPGVTNINNGNPFKIGRSLNDPCCPAPATPTASFDDLRTYGRALTAAEVTDLFNYTAAPASTCLPPPSGMVSWWPGDGNASDLKGSNNGTLQNGATFAAGKVDQAFSFNGTSAYVQLPNAALNSPAGTIDMWIHPSANPQGAFGFGSVWFAKQHNNVDSYAVFGFASPLDSRVRFHLKNSAPEVTGTNPLALNTWHHVAATWDGTFIRIYVNGVKEGEVASAATLPSDLSASMAIGAWLGDGNSFFSGMIDEAGTASRALTAAEIQAIYDAGSAGKCKTSPAPTVSLTAPASIDEGAAPATLTATGSDPDGDALTYTWTLVSGSGRLTPSGATAALSSPNGPASLVVKVDVSDGASTSSDTKTVQVNNVVPTANAGPDATVTEDQLFTRGPVALAHYWPADSSANDLSGGRNGVLENGASLAPGKYGQAFSFDGMNDRVALPGSFNGQEATIAAWVQTTGMTGDFQALLSSQTQSFVHLQLNGFGNNVVYTNTGAVELPIIPQTPTGTWRHIALSIKSGDTRLYVDGVQVGSSAATFSTIAPASDVLIGSGYAGGRPFKGLIDDVRIYGTALTATEVTALAGGSLLPGTFADPGADTWSATVNYGDGPDQPLVLNPDMSFTLSHTWATPGIRTVTISVSDGAATGTDSFQVTVNPPPDTTPPVITSTVSGTQGNGGYYRSNVTVSWSVSDAESAITARTGCDEMPPVTTDTMGSDYTCTATSSGGTASATVTVKRDTAPPTVTFLSPQADEVLAGNPATVRVAASDSTSGVASVAINGVSATLVSGSPLGGTWQASVPITLPVAPGGALTFSAVAADVAGNAAAPAMLTLDNDGIASAIDASPGTYANDFSDVPLGGATFGTISSRGGFLITVTDLASPSGVQIQASGSGAAATINACGIAGAVRFTSAGQASISCVPSQAFPGRPATGTPRLEVIALEGGVTAIRPAKEAPTLPVTKGKTQTTKSKAQTTKAKPSAAKAQTSKAQIGKAKPSVTKSKAQRTKAQGGKATAKAQSAKAKTQTAKAKPQVTKSKSTKAQAKTQTARAKSAKAQAKAQAAKAKNQKATAKAQAAKAKAQLGSAKSQIAPGTTQTSKAKTAAGAKAQTAKAKTRTAKAKPAASKAKAQTAKAKPAATKAKTQNAKAKPATAKAKTQVAKAKPATSKAKAQLAKAKPQIAKAKPQTSKAKTQTAKAKTQAQQAKTATRKTKAPARTAPAKKATTKAVKLKPGQRASMGSPIVADSANVGEVEVEILDEDGNVLGTALLSPGAVADVAISDEGDFLVEQLDANGSVDFATSDGLTFGLAQGVALSMLADGSSVLVSTGATPANVTANGTTITLGPGSALASLAEGTVLAMNLETTAPATLVLGGSAVTLGPDSALADLADGDFLAMNLGSSVGAGFTVDGTTVALGPDSALVTLADGDFLAMNLGTSAGAGFTVDGITLTLGPDSALAALADGDFLAMNVGTASGAGFTIDGTTVMLSPDSVLVDLVDGDFLAMNVGTSTGAGFTVDGVTVNLGPESTLVTLADGDFLAMSLGAAAGAGFTVDGATLSLGPDSVVVDLADGDFLAMSLGTSAGAGFTVDGVSLVFGVESALVTSSEGDFLAMNLGSSAGAGFTVDGTTLTLGPDSVLADLADGDFLAMNLGTSAGAGFTVDSTTLSLAPDTVLADLVDGDFLAMSLGAVAGAGFTVDGITLGLGSDSALAFLADGDLLAMNVGSSAGAGFTVDGTTVTLAPNSAVADLADGDSLIMNLSAAASVSVTVDGITLTLGPDTSLASLADGDFLAINLGTSPDAGFSVDGATLTLGPGSVLADLVDGDFLAMSLGAVAGAGFTLDGVTLMLGPDSALASLADGDFLAMNIGTTAGAGFTLDGTSLTLSVGAVLNVFGNDGDFLAINLGTDGVAGLTFGDLVVALGPGVALNVLPNGSFLSTNVIEGAPTEFQMNGATFSVPAGQVLLIDQTPPTIGGSRAPAAGPSGWNNSTVTVQFVCSDGESGIATCTEPVTLAEGANQSVTGVAEDKQGNTASTTVSGINVDKTSPKTTATRSREPNANGWNNTDVTVTLTAIDPALATGQPASGVVRTEYNLDVAGWSPYTSGITISAEGIHTLLYRSADLAGNVEEDQTVTVRIDKTRPVVTVLAPITAEATSPAGAAVAFTASATDAVTPSPAVTCELASGSTFALGTTTVTCRATDGADNTGEASFTVTVVDTTAPTVTCGSADGTWHPGDVSVSCTASDGGSGLANSGDATFTLSTSVPAGTETPNAATDSRNVCDTVGNCTLAGPVSGNKVDKRTPSITIGSPAGGIHLLNESVAASYACADGGSGVAICQGPVASGANMDTGSVGTKSFTVNASDQVGNTSSETAAYTLTYKVCPLFDQSKANKSGSTVPIKLQLCDASGRNVSSAALTVNAVGVHRTSDNASAEVDDAGNANPDANFRYDPALGGYIFNLKTTGYQVGTYALTFSVTGDPVQHTVQFQVR